MGYFLGFSVALLLCMCTVTDARNSGVYFITAPNLLRLNSVEKVAINVFNVTDLAIAIRLQDYPNRTKSFSESLITVSEDEAASVDIQVRTTDLPDDQGEPVYVYLVAESTDEQWPFYEESMILVDRNFGFIFVQTDKPIYTPDQEVKIRVITLDEERRPTSTPVQIDIKNPQGVIVQRWSDSYRDKFILKKFQLPSIPFFGKNWTVTAKYTDGLTTSSTVNFEVKEYVLPRYEVNIELPDAEIILPSTEWVNVTVTAKYVYGKVVSGGVTLTFGIIADGNHETCPVTFNKMLVNGETRFEINIEEIKSGLEEFWFPDGAKLLVEAAVTDDTSGRREMAFDKTAVFSNYKYLVSVDKSQKYFKPGLLYRLHVETYWANGKYQPAPNVQVAIEIKRFADIGLLSSVRRTETTNNHGTFTYLVFMGKFENRISIKVEVLDPSANDTLEQSSVTLNVFPLQSPTNNYISVWPNQAAGDLLVDTISTAKRNQSLVYLLLSGGRILDSEVSMDLFRRPITGKYSPNIWLVVFFLTNETDGAEVVADTTWMDMDDVCERELALSKQKHKIEPGDPEGLTLYVSGPPHGLVGFLAVDKAVYLMNNKNILRRHTMFRRFGSHALSCGYGGGNTASEVFENSGLVVLSNADIDTRPRQSPKCEKRKRNKRSAENAEEELNTHPCCVGGDIYGRSVPSIKDCYHEGKAVYTATNSTSCSKVFFFCCRLYSPIEVTTDIFDFGRTVRRGLLEYTFRDVVVDFENSDIRSYFPESWMFEEDDYLDENGSLEKNFAIPDSITTHIIQAVTLSEDYGMCVAQPERVKTFRNFFVDLDLPYSIVRLEQAEVRATIYNFLEEKMPCLVYIKSPEEICTQRSESDFIRVEVHSNSAELVKFPIVPLTAGEYELEIGVFAINGTNDRVRKTVFVINEGREEKKTVSFWLDPQEHKPSAKAGGDLRVNILHPSPYLERQETTVDLTLPEKAIPGTGHCKVSAMGNIMDTAVHSMIEGVGNWLNTVPHGCGEQTMIMLAPVVYAFHYLKRTEQMTTNLKKRGETLMRLGYQRELTFRKEDGSFAVWRHKPSSTWLTAFVVKVFSEVSEFLDIDTNVVCSGVKWLVSHQKSDGSFVETFPVYHKEMMGGLNGDVSLTAYILVALMESKCNLGDSVDHIALGLEYLEINLDIMDQTYALSLMTYALALGKSARTDEAVNKLKSYATESVDSDTGIHGLRYWTVNHFMKEVPSWYHQEHVSAMDVEMTSYAILTLLKVGDIEYSHNAVEWLLTQRGSSGEFVSTQDTVVGLQALSEYNIRSFALKIDLHSRLKVTSNETLEHNIVLSDNDVAVQKSVHDIPVNGKLQVTTEGTGVGRMEVEVRYNVNVTDDQRCKFSIDVYDSEVKLNFFQSKGMATDMECDACGYCEQQYDEDTEEYLEKYNIIDLDPRIAGDIVQEVEGGEGQRLERLRRSPVVMRMHGASKEQTCLEICVSYTGYEVLDMPVVDVGLPTGYSVDNADLTQLKDKGKLDNFEISKRSVTFYLEKIPEDDEICFKFRVIREFEVENLQAAKIEVYDYYKTEERCIKFYSLRYDVADLDIFCSSSKRENCHCVEGKCAESWDSKIRYGRISKVITEIYRMICNDFDFAIRVEVSNIIHVGNHLIISTVVKGVTKQGAEHLRVNDEIEFWMNVRCNLLVQVDESYIIYGKNGIPYIDQHGITRYRYFLQGETVILKDYTLRKYTTTYKLRQWKRTFRRMESYIRRRGC